MLSCKFDNITIFKVFDTHYMTCKTFSPPCRFFNIYGRILMDVFSHYSSSCIVFKTYSHFYSPFFSSFWPICLIFALSFVFGFKFTSEMLVIEIIFNHMTSSKLQERVVDLREVLKFKYFEITRDVTGFIGSICEFTLMMSSYQNTIKIGE